MEKRETTTDRRQPNFNEFADHFRDDELVRQRLNTLLAINAETAREKAAYHSAREKFEAGLMRNPLSIEETYSYFGLMLGAFPPAAMFIRAALEGRLAGWVVGVMLVVNLISSVVGYFSGKVIARNIRFLENTSWSLMILALPFLGLLWGILAGAAGGVVIFFVGAFFGGILGGLVGAAALPLFTVLHRLVKKGESIERKHFLPLAFGVTFMICGFILGL
ncbi:MAG: hypothetical protein JSS81_07990 [Acidobacteria bacterium]|nr:hypothetical protein [Acidobacteriota bacterium]